MDHREHKKAFQPLHVSCAAQSAPLGALSSAGPVPAVEHRSMCYHVLGCKWTEKKKMSQTRIQVFLCLCQSPDIASLGCSVHQGQRRFVTNQATADFHTTHSSPAKRPSHSTGKLHLLKTTFTFCTFLNQKSNSNER